ncbi:MAG: hypothetical protein IPJ71_19105 [Bdellovibrionales bacterium]|nr:hypothetical protein [Bdellovibrionales bacterium]
MAASDLSFAVKVMVKFDLRANRSFPDLIQDPGFFNPSSIEEYVQAWSEFQLSPGARLNHALLIKDAWQTF